MALGTLCLELGQEVQPGGFCILCGAQQQIPEPIQNLKILIAPLIRNQHDSQGGWNTCQIGRVFDLLMADPFGPGHRGGVGQVNHRLIAGTVSLPGLMPRGLSEERVAAIADAKTKLQQDQCMIHSGFD